VTTLTQPTTFVTPEEYLAAERAAETRSEYVNGVVCPMTGANVNHIRIVRNLTILLGTILEDGPCELLPTEIKVRLPDSQKFFYPDLTVVCGELQFPDDRRDVVLNPTLIIEVLSESTEAFDRGEKFQSYQQIDSLREYVLVAQAPPLVEQFVRQDDGSWIYTPAAGREHSLTLSSVACQLSLDAIYKRVD
jgi:Uma2 family endonuclease